MSHRLDDPSALLSLLQQWTAPPEVKSRLEASGFTTLGLLGHALPSADKEDSFIITVLGLDPNNPALLHSAAAACLRRLFAAAQDLCPLAPVASLSALPSGSAQPALVKLSPTDVQALRQNFQASYPGELLTPEAMPAPEFLSALQHTFTSGASPWLPWRSRCTEADAISWHDSRRPRSQLLRTLLEAEEEAPGPTAFVPQSSPVKPTVRKALSSALARDQTIQRQVSVLCPCRPVGWIASRPTLQPRPRVAHVPNPRAAPADPSAAPPPAPEKTPSQAHQVRPCSCPWP